MGIFYLVFTCFNQYDRSRLDDFITGYTPEISHGTWASRKKTGQNKHEAQSPRTRRLRLMIRSDDIMGDCTVSDHIVSKYKIK